MSTTARNIPTCPRIVVETHGPGPGGPGVKPHEVIIHCVLQAGHEGRCDFGDPQECQA